MSKALKLDEKALKRYLVLYESNTYIVIFLFNDWLRGKYANYIVRKINRKTANIEKMLDYIEKGEELWNQ